MEVVKLGSWEVEKIKDEKIEARGNYY